jgi:hypothetical protein
MIYIYIYTCICEPSCTARLTTGGGGVDGRLVQDGKVEVQDIIDNVRVAPSFKAGECDTRPLGKATALIHQLGRWMILSRDS